MCSDCSTLPPPVPCHCPRAIGIRWRSQPENCFGKLGPERYGGGGLECGGKPLDGDHGQAG